MDTEEFRPHRIRLVSNDSPESSKNNSPAARQTETTTTITNDQQQEDDLETKNLLNRVANINISSSSSCLSHEWSETTTNAENEAVEVSFTEDDATTSGASCHPYNTTTDSSTTSSSSSLMEYGCSTSPLRAVREKRKLSAAATPVVANSLQETPNREPCETPRIGNLMNGPKRKKRRPGSLLDAPRLPTSPFMDSDSPFRILNCRVQANRHHPMSLSSSSSLSAPPTPKANISPIQTRQISSMRINAIRSRRLKSLAGRRRRQQRQEQQHRIPFFPALLPDEEEKEMALTLPSSRQIMRRHHNHHQSLSDENLNDSGAFTPVLAESSPSNHPAQSPRYSPILSPPCLPPASENL